MHWIEENHKVSKGQTKMECGEFISPTTEGGNYVERNLLGLDVKLGMQKCRITISINLF